MAVLNCTDLELSTYLRALEEGYSPISSLATCRSELSRLIPIANRSYQQGKRTVFFHGFQSLTMCKLSTADHGADSSISSRVDSPAKTSLALEKERESKDQGVGFGSKWLELSVKFDLVLCSWKTHRSLFPEALPWSSVILPKWGLMLDGVCYRRVTAERPIKGIDSGSWPTPSADESQPTEEFIEEMRANQGKTHERLYLPGRKYHSQRTLSRVVHTWPTSKTGGLKDRDSVQKMKTKGLNDQEISSMRSRSGGQLNPTWVEWLMGWPLGWTDLERLETDKFREWRREHGRY